jgi:propanol-preferring alcohol dehydrogenase
MILKEISSLEENANPLHYTDIPEPIPADDELMIRVSACGVCHTELDEIEGRIPPPVLPVVPGHQVIGWVEAVGSRTSRFGPGERIGVAWIYSACGRCAYCQNGRENLCPDFAATGRDVNGGYAEYMIVPEPFAYRIPKCFNDSEAAPLLCAGAIGYRSLRLSNHREGQNLGLVGFGASAHIVLKLVRHRYPDSRIFVFARSENERKFAIELGAVWAGDIGETSPEKLDASIDTTPVWRPVVEAMENLAPGGKLVINAIRKEEADREYLLQLDYKAHLWLEKEIQSVANVTRNDVTEFLRLAAEIPIKPEIEEFPLEDANRALVELKKRRIRGAKVLVTG